MLTGREGKKRRGGGGIQATKQNLVTPLMASYPALWASLHVGLVPVELVTPPCPFSQQHLILVLLAREALMPQSVSCEAPLQCTCLAFDMETFLGDLSVLQARLVCSVLHAAMGACLNCLVEVTAGVHWELEEFLCQFTVEHSGGNFDLENSRAALGARAPNVDDSLRHFAD